MRFSRLIILLFALFAIGMVAAACTSDDDGEGDTAQGETLKTVLDRGVIKVGVKDSQPGFGNLEQIRSEIGMVFQQFNPRGAFEGPGSTPTTTLILLWALAYRSAAMPPKEDRVRGHTSFQDLWLILGGWYLCILNQAV